jgi:hypothetical protein
VVEESKYDPIEALDLEAQDELVSQQTWILKNIGSGLDFETEYAMLLLVLSIVVAFHLSELCLQQWICVLHLWLNVDLMHNYPFIYVSVFVFVG